jgi:hypothetical protein
MLYPTSLSCHSCWHVENLPEISCCSQSEIWLLPPSYTTPLPPLRSVKPDSFIPGDAYHETRLCQGLNWHHLDGEFADCSEKCLGWPLRIPIMGSIKLDT